MHISQEIYKKNHISRGESFPFSVGNKGIPLCPFSVGPFYHRLCYSEVPLFYGVFHWAPDGEVLLRGNIWSGSSTSGGVWGAPSLRGLSLGSWWGGTPEGGHLAWVLDFWRVSVGV